MNVINVQIYNCTSTYKCVTIIVRSTRDEGCNTPLAPEGQG